jgi:hypothetical protein
MVECKKHNCTTMNKEGSSMLILTHCIWGQGVMLKVMPQTPCIVYGSSRSMFLLAVSFFASWVLLWLTYHLKLGERSLGLLTVNTDHT